MIPSYSRSHRRMSAQVSKKKPTVNPTNSASCMTYPPSGRLEPCPTGQTRHVRLRPQLIATFARTSIPGALGDRGFAAAPGMSLRRRSALARAAPIVEPSFVMIE